MPDQYISDFLAFLTRLSTGRMPDSFGLGAPLFGQRVAPYASH
jgi:hypothetical protein